MREPNKNHVYSLDDLTSEEKTELGNKIFRPENIDNVFKFSYIRYDKELKIWLATECVTPTTNAKELFYTLEDVQVDCRGLSEEQIREMLGVYESKGYRIYKGKECLSVSGNNYLLGTANQTFFISISSKYHHTITYVKFMELFGSKSEQNVEVSKEFCKLLTEEISRQPTQEEIASIFSSREKESEKRDLKLKKTLKYLLKKDIILTPKQYKKLWKKS